jgi:8-oxo-dGTP pyrophosphatase MutT (NUDIX family)
MSESREHFVVAAHLILISQDKVLLLRRFNTGYQDGNYSVPAGHVEKDETVTEAMIREAKEEAGITLTNDDLSLVHVMNRDSSCDRIDFFFQASKWEDKPSIQEPDKCDDLSWHDMNSLPPNMVPYVRFALEQIRKDVSYSEFTEALVDRSP